MDITIRELDESNVELVSRCASAFIVDSKLCLQAENGEITLRKNWNQYGYIEDLTVDIKYRKLGVGRRLITKAIEWTKSKKLPVERFKK